LSYFHEIHPQGASLLADYELGADYFAQNIGQGLGSMHKTYVARVSGIGVRLEASSKFAGSNINIY
jgi:hypothetical protein